MIDRAGGMERRKGIFRWMMGIGGCIVVMWIMIGAKGAAEEGEVVESKAEFFLGCMRLALWRGPYFEALAPSDRWQAGFCNDILRFHGFSYENNGVLAPGYKEALLMRYKGNRTLVDFEICGMCIQRCPQPLLNQFIRYEFDELMNAPVDLQLQQFDDF